MKKSLKKTLAILLCLVLMLNLLPLAARAEAAAVEMTEGEILSGFAAGKEAVSSDSSVAWVDAEGNLNALREGTTTVTVDGDDYTVTVSDYTDGSEIAGKLKLLARYNDSMQFYDGHVYLLFTSYLDGVEIKVDDLYAGYEISEAYYHDIKRDLSKGSHRTGTDTEKYFTLRGGMNKTVLNRGEIVTLGMYRDFAISVPEALIGSLRNSTAWKLLSAEAKAAAVDTLLEAVETESLNTEAILARLMAIAGVSQGIQPRDWLDGQISGGVCFNRELYNQKLEYDQFENATYEIEITENQLAALMAALGGNLNRFSMLKNSCATVALRAWNAAVGLRENEKTAYYLKPEGEGVFAYIDAPKTVKSEITARLPGYYLNNAEGVAEPDAGYFDEEAGEWVYVSAPERLAGEEEPGEEEPDETLTVAVKGAPADHVEVYRLENGEHVAITSGTAVAPGTEIYVSAPNRKTEGLYLAAITLNGAPLTADGEGLYKAVMPEGGARITVEYEEYELRAKGQQTIQLFAGDTLDLADCVELYAEEEPVDFSDNSVVWFGPEFSEGLSFTSDTKSVIKAEKAGDYFVAATMKENQSILVFFTLEVLDPNTEMAAVTWETEGEGFVLLSAAYEDENAIVGYSGRLVRVGSVISYEASAAGNSLLTAVTVNGEPCAPGEPIVVGAEGIALRFLFSPVFISGVPEEIALPTAADTYQLAPCVLSEEGAAPAAEITFTYASADPLVEIGEDGTVRIAQEIPRGGKAVPITVSATSGNCVLTAASKVIVGNYVGGRIVGRLTIATRKFTPGQILAPHAYVALSPYDYTDLSVSYFNRYLPQEEYAALTRDYANNPENYPADPVLYTEEIPIENRADYFEFREKESKAEPETISLIPGETITLTSYPLDESKFVLIMDALRNGKIATSTATQALVEQLELYMEGEEFDRTVFFDSFFEMLIQAGTILYTTGENPIDGLTPGGITVDRELYSQFTNLSRYSFCDYYTVELTADELAAMNAYLSETENNTYSLLIDNCVTTASRIWNAAMYDRPELQVQTSLAGVLDSPEVLRKSIFSITAPDGFCGTNYYPRLMTRIARFDPNGGSGAMEAQYFADSVPAALNGSLFTRPDYLFAGWNTEPSGCGESFADGESAALTADLTLYAQWIHEPIPCEMGEDCPMAKFTDLNVNAWYHDGVHWSLENGIVSGYGNGTFGPNDPTSRAMLLTMLYRMEGEPAVDFEMSFPDVNNDAWYAEAVRWAAANGIVSGYGDGSFAPNDVLTREQLAAILYRYAQTRGQGFPEGRSYPLNFSDASDVSGWAREAVCWMAMKGVVQGTGDNELSPKVGASRAQVATMLMRYALLG